MIQFYIASPHTSFSPNIKVYIYIYIVWKVENC